MADYDTHYRGHLIRHEPPPIPTRAFDWAWCHEDYDGAPDSHDDRYGYAETEAEARAAIDKSIAECPDV